MEIVTTAENFGFWNWFWVGVVPHGPLPLGNRKKRGPLLQKNLGFGWVFWNMDHCRTLPKSDRMGIFTCGRFQKFGWVGVSQRAARFASAGGVIKIQ